MRLFIIFAILSLGSYFDIKTLEIPDIFFALVLLCKLKFDPMGLIIFLCENLIYFSILLAANHKNRTLPLGFGDIKILSALSYTLGIGNCMLIFAYSSIASGIYAVFLIVSKKISGSHEIAFLPFISFGCFVLLLQQELPKYIH